MYLNYQTCNTINILKKNQHTNHSVDKSCKTNFEKNHSELNRNNFLCLTASLYTPMIT